MSMWRTSNTWKFFLSTWTLSTSTTYAILPVQNDDVYGHCVRPEATLNFECSSWIQPLRLGGPRVKCLHVRMNIVISIWNLRLNSWNLCRCPCQWQWTCTPQALSWETWPKSLCSLFSFSCMMMGIQMLCALLKEELESYRAWEYNMTPRYKVNTVWLAVERIHRYWAGVARLDQEVLLPPPHQQRPSPSRSTWTTISMSLSFR